MAILTLIDGKKGPGDILVLLKADDEPLSFAEWLFIGKCYMDSEASYYPISEGYSGPCMLLEAVIELSHGMKFDMVLEKFKLKRKGLSLQIVDKRKAAESVGWERDFFESKSSDLGV
jgi:hypothetical protein